MNHPTTEKFIHVWQATTPDGTYTPGTFFATVDDYMEWIESKVIQTENGPAYPIHAVQFNDAMYYLNEMHNRWHDTIVGDIAEQLTDAEMSKSSYHVYAEGGKFHAFADFVIFGEWCEQYIKAGRVDVTLLVHRDYLGDVHIYQERDAHWQVSLAAREMENLPAELPEPGAIDTDAGSDTITFIMALDLGSFGFDDMDGLL